MAMNPSKNTENMGNTQKKSELLQLLENLENSKKAKGEFHPDTATCHYQLGLYYLNAGQGMDATNHLGDALYIRRQHFSEDSPRISELYYALQQSTLL